MARLAKIKKDNPALAERSDVQEVAGDIDNYAALAGFASSEAGKLLVVAFNADIASAVNRLVAGYKTLPEIELRSIGAEIEVRLNTLRSLTHARTNLDMAEEYLGELTK